MTPRPLALRTVLLTVVALAGCRESTLTDSRLPEDMDGSASGFLRLDVYPSNLDADLLPETFVLEDEWEGLAIEMDAPVQIEGVITGYDAAPHIVPNVPGEDATVQAMIQAWVPGTVMAGGTVSGEDGVWSLRLVPAAGYYVSIVPVDPADLPYVVDHPVDVGGGEGGGSTYLDYGVAVHGRVSTEEGVPLPGTRIQAVDALTGVGGPILATDAAGWYDMRLLPGEYDITVSGLDGSYVPTCTVPVYAEEQGGAEQDFVYGALVPVTVEGDVDAADVGVGVDGIEVRFTSVVLDDHDACSLVVATNTDQYGHFSARILPGRYVMEVVPPYNVALSPLRETVDVGTIDGEILGRIALEGFTTLSSMVVAPGDGGAPVEGVHVHVEVEGFDGYTYDTYTDEVGAFELEVPHTTVSVTVTPGTDAWAVQRFESTVADFPKQVELTRGRRIDGTITYEGRPVAYAPIEVRDSQDNLYVSTTTDEDGAFAVRVNQE